MTDVAQDVQYVVAHPVGGYRCFEGKMTLNHQLGVTMKGFNCRQ